MATSDWMAEYDISNQNHTGEGLDFSRPIRGLGVKMNVRDVFFSDLIQFILGNVKRRVQFYTIPGKYGKYGGKLTM